jgi:hypothetical protein
VAFDPLLAIRTLNDHGVRYVVIGGFAGQLLGAPLTTQDIDVCYDRGARNLERLAGALRELHARLRVARASADDVIPFIIDAATLRAGDSFTFETDAGDLDVLGTPSGTKGFADLAPHAVVLDLGDGLEVPVVALADLIRMKRTSRRPKDQAALDVLLTLDDVLRERDDPGP